MSFHAPLRVPVELRRVSRWFRMAHEVSVNGLTLGSPVPDDLDGPVEVAFVLPGGAPLRCRATVAEVVVGDGEGERAERRAIRFVDLDQDGAARIQAYVEERLGLTL